MPNISMLAERSNLRDLKGGKEKEGWIKE